MNGTASSQECGLQLEIGAKSTHLDAFIRKATRYTLMMSAVTIVHKQLRKLSCLETLLYSISLVAYSLP